MSKFKTKLISFFVGLYGISIATATINAHVEMDPTGMSVIGSGGTSSYSRKVETSLGIYTKNGTIPGVTQKDISYAGVKVHILEIDATNTGGTFIQVDYAGKDSDDKPKYMNNFYDKDLTSNDNYYWVGAINAGFFNNSSSSSMYGYPTGAVKQNGQEAVYNSSGTNYEDVKCSPAYGNGFVTLHLNKNDDMKLIYNGWKNGNFYKYAGDTNPNSWEYGDYPNWQDAVSGAYTLKVDGNNTTWGKGDYTSVDYWTYGNAVTLFGQKSNGNFVMVTTDTTLTGNDQQSLMSYLDVVDAIRFDGGGSTQMVFDKGLVVDHYFNNLVVDTIVEGDAFSGNNIAFDIYMKNGKYYYANIMDVPQAEYWFTDPVNGQIIDIKTAQAGIYNLHTEFNGIQQISKITVEPKIVNHTVTFQDKNGEVISAIEVAEGNTVIAPEAPSIDGYEFIGWDKSLENIKEDLVITAQYEPIQYEIKLNYDGGTVVVENPNTYTVEDTITINNPTKIGYKFVGWTSEDSDELIMELKFEKGSMGDVSYKANYELSDYAILYRFDALNVINDKNPISFKYGQETVLKEPIAKGYNFIGWYLNGNILPEGIISSDIAEDIELYGKFEAIKYILDFNNESAEDIEFTIEELPLELPILENTETHIFAGWYTNEKFEGKPIKQITDIGSQTVYAKWIENELETEIFTIQVNNKVDKFELGQIVTNDLFTVIATDSNNNSFEVTDFTISPNTPLVEGENILTFEYKGIVVNHIIVVEDGNNNNIVDQESHETIQLVASKASSYSVVLPKQIDITDDTVEFDVKVKGDISSVETIVVSMGNTVLKEVVNEAGTPHQDVMVTTNFGENNSKRYTAKDIFEENITKATLTHEPLSAGTWAGELTVNVAIEKTGT